MNTPLENYGPISSAMERWCAPRTIEIESLGSRTLLKGPERWSVSLRPLSSMSQWSTFKTDEAESLIPVTSGVVKIIWDAGLAGTGRFMAPVPRSRLIVPNDLQGYIPLRIISDCAAPHEIVLRYGEIVRFDPEVGANVELMGIAGAVVVVGLYKAEVVYEDVPIIR